MSTRRIVHAAPLLALLIALALVPSAFAGKGGGNGGKNKSYTGTISGPVMVSDANSNGAPNWADGVTFNVSSNAPYYFVEVDCSQSGTLVYQSAIGFYPGWPWSKTFYLQSAAWSGGAADCSARLYSSNSDGSNQQTLATLSFSVGA